MMIAASLKSIVNMHYPFYFLFIKRQENIYFSLHQRQKSHDMFKKEVCEKQVMFPILVVPCIIMIIYFDNAVFSIQ